jgi:hypothetical protein
MALNEGTYSATACAEYSDFTGGISTIVNGLPARKIVMKAAGNLVYQDPAGTTVTLTNLPQWYEHTAQVASLDATQTVAVIVYW